MSVKVLMAGGNNLAQSLWCIKRGFERAGCEVKHIVSVGNGPNGKQLLPEAEAYLMKHASEADLLYWWQPQSNQLADGVITALRKAWPKLRTVCQSLDDPFVLDVNPATEVFREFEVAVTCCEGSMEWYTKRGVKPIIGYPPVDRDLHGKAQPNVEEICDIGFAATNVYPPHLYPACYADRVSMVKAVMHLGKLHVYGTWGVRRMDWGGEYGLPKEMRSACRGYYEYERMPGVHAATRINLNSHVRPDGYRYLNERVGQCMASGGFMLCDEVGGIAETFAENKEIVLWKTLPELTTKAKWWLAHDAERRAVAEAGRPKALELFDNEKLARRMLAACGLAD